MRLAYRNGRLIANDIAGMADVIRDHLIAELLHEDMLQRINDATKNNRVVGSLNKLTEGKLK